MLVLAQHMFTSEKGLVRPQAWFGADSQGRVQARSATARGVSAHSARTRGCAGGEGREGAGIMKVKDGMSRVVLSVGPAHTLRQAAKMMAAQHVGAAVVVDHDRSGIGILTERDVLKSLGANQDPDVELVSEHRTHHVVFASQ